MFRRISTKWMLGVLAVVIVPFAGLAAFVHIQVRGRLAGEVVRYHLLSIAADLADRLDASLEERKLDLEVLAADPFVGWQLHNQLEARLAGDGPPQIFKDEVQNLFDNFIRASRIYDLVLSLDVEGRLAVCNQRGADGKALEEALLQSLGAADFREQAWFQTALEQGYALVDPGPSLGFGDPGGPLRYGFARRIEIDPDQPASRETVGVLLLLVNWSHMQGQIANYGVRNLEKRGSVDGDVVREDLYRSSYAWIWADDADTILAHEDPSLYGLRVSEEPIGLTSLVEAARSQDWGLYPEYSFRGKLKKAAFKHCRARDEAGFGWIVGVGVDVVDIIRPVDRFLRLLLTVSGAVLGVAALGTVLLARRFVRPIHALQAHTGRIASGDLEARIDLERRDELGDLAASFNRMSSELHEKREQLVKVEKEAAWREMARQVAHEIKNPLTPINLSVGLLRRSHQEGSKDFDSIFQRTLDMIQRQVETMRGIVTDFYAFAGEHRRREVVDLGALLDEVLEWNRAWAQDLGVPISRRGGGGEVLGDAEELSRALQNLVSNALEAMSADGGELHARVTTTSDEVCVELRDHGPGISDEARGRLFEPYFTTRSSGTGLGLAIVRRVVEDMGGQVELANAPEGPGALARLVLPRYEGGSTAEDGA